MIVVDSSALMAVLKKEPDWAEFLHLIRAAATPIMSAMAYLETSIVLAGRKGNAQDWTELDDLVQRANIEIVAHDAELALIARQAFLRFGKGRHPTALNFGDCASYALAKSRNMPLLFKGRDFTQTDLRAAN